MLKRVPVAGELLIGEALYLLLGELLIAAVVLVSGSGDLLKLALGFLEGVILAAVMLIHMTASVEDSVAMYEDEALKHTRKSYIIRMLILLAAFCLIFFLRLGDIIAALLGLMSLKVAAYIQPFTHKILQKNTSKGR